MKGYKGGRKHRIDLLSMCDRMARNEGVTLESMLWQVIKGLALAAARGNVPAAKLLFDFMAKKDDQTNRIDARFVFDPSNGPKLPENLGEYLQAIDAAQGDLGSSHLLTVEPEVIKDATPMVDPELARFLGVAAVTFRDRVVLVCGGRCYTDSATLRAVLDAVSPTLVIAGCAKGADKLAHEWAQSRGVPSQRFRAEWKKFGVSAGPRRNERMLREGKPSLVVAFEGGRRTADMVRKAQDAGVPQFCVPEALGAFLV